MDVHSLVNSIVKIITIDNKIIQGQLVSIDQVSNCVLRDAKVDDIDIEAYFIRGDSIAVLGR